MKVISRLLNKKPKSVLYLYTIYNSLYIAFLFMKFTFSFRLISPQKKIPQIFYFFIFKPNTNYKSKQKFIQKRGVKTKIQIFIFPICFISKFFKFDKRSSSKYNKIYQKIKCYIFNTIFNKVISYTYIQLYLLLFIILQNVILTFRFNLTIYVSVMIALSNYKLQAM